MTKLIILLCFSFGRLAGQTAFDSAGRYIPPKAGAMFIDPGFYQPGNHDFVAKADASLYDTIPIIMLVGDTANHTEIFEHGIDFSHAKRSGIGWTGAVVIYDTVQWRSQKVEQVAGYEVRTHGEAWNTVIFRGYGPLDGTYSGQHVAYLDENKKPLKLYVWQTAKP
jgi:hypothetical protein